MKKRREEFTKEEEKEGMVSAHVSVYLSRNVRDDIFMAIQV